MLLASTALPIRDHMASRTAGGAVLRTGSFRLLIEEGWIRVVSCCSPAPLNEACRLRQSRSIANCDKREGTANCSTKCTTAALPEDGFTGTGGFRGFGRPRTYPHSRSRDRFRAAGRRRDYQAGFSDISEPAAARSCPHSLLAASGRRGRRPAGSQVATCGRILRPYPAAPLQPSAGCRQGSPRAPGQWRPGAGRWPPGRRCCAPSIPRPSHGSAVTAASICEAAHDGAPVTRPGGRDRELCRGRGGPASYHHRSRQRLAQQFRAGGAAP